MSFRNWRSVLALVCFILANVAVLVPFRIPFPAAFASGTVKLLRRMRIVSQNKALETHRIGLPVNFVTAPIIAVFFLWAVGSISARVIREGIVGDAGISPLNVMALFISLAYITVSLDATGLFQFLALWVAKKGGTSGRKLYTLLYLFFFGAGIIVGNDPVILSGTPFLAYLTDAMQISPTPWIFSQFVSCNVASAALISSNPTNIVIAGAFSLTFLQYSSWLIIPVLFAALFLLPTLFLLFSRLGYSKTETHIPKTLAATDVRPVEALVDKHGAVFGSVILLSTLAVLVGTSVLRVAVWKATVPAALIVILRDVLHDRPHWGLRRSTAKRHDAPSPTTMPVELQERPAATQRRDSDNAATLLQNSRSQEQERGSLDQTFAHLKTALNTSLPTLTTILPRLPFALLPFAFAMFILVQGLVISGWVALFAGWWGLIVSHTGPIGAIFFMGLISCLACNVCGTNIGATILLARVIKQWMDSPSGNTISSRARDGAVFALALGSNYGAFTAVFSASLAGLLWRGILEQKGIHVRMGEFAKLNVVLVGVCMAVSCAVLVGQVYIVHSA